MRVILAALLLLLAACSPSTGAAKGGGGPPPPCYTPEVEPNDSTATATFVTVLTPPDLMHFCGEIGLGTDNDDYKFFTPQSEYVSFVITNEGNVPLETYVYSQDVSDDSITLVGHFVGDPGNLSVMALPVPVTNDGFHIKISSPSHVACEYHVEIWTPGFLPE